MKSIWQSLAPASVFCIFIFLGSILLSSCNYVELPTVPEAIEKTPEGAELLFVNGDFEKALNEYQYIHRTALAPEERNNALYGIGCSQMILARSDEQLAQAISTLQRWDANKGSAPNTENRHLLILALKQQRDLIVDKNRQIDEQEQKKNSVIENQKKKISQMSATLRELQKQLQELEDIDEIFQGKRKPL